MMQDLDHPGRWDRLVGVAAVSIGLPALARSFYPHLWTWPPTRAQVVVFVWTALILAGTLAGAAAWRRRQGQSGEPLRWTLLAGVGVLLLRGLLRFTLHGAGDAGWYGTMLADMVSQTRSGIFPVWTGQSEYQFNGAIYPLRIAPAFHYLGALLDTVTARTLGVYALQNLLLTLLGLGGIFSAYFSLGALLPGHRWIAAGLAILFLACPGVLGVVYIDDLFMSWTTLPWIPLAFFATVRSFRDGGALSTLLLLGGSLGLCWWGHSPIALWMTFLAGAAQVVRCLCRPPSSRGWRHAAAGLTAFLAIAAYPIGSVLFFPPEPTVATVSFQSASPGTIVHFLAEPEVFPATFLPLSRNGRLLGDFQLGYALWILLAFALWNARQVRQLEARVLFGIPIFLLLLLTPIPGVNPALWWGVPGVIRNVTGNWVMNRLYLVLAGAAIYGLAAALDGDLLESPARRRILACLVAAGCLWSIGEAGKFARGSRAGTRPDASAVDQLRLENVAITRFAYMIFPRLPAYFTHSVDDPLLENRLWSEQTGKLLASNWNAALAGARIVARAEFVAAPANAGNILRLPYPLRLEPGRRYLLAVDFAELARARGVLEITGPSLFRIYGLPEYGEAESFGAGALHSDLIPLWTSDPGGETAAAVFVPDASVGKAAALVPLARTTWMEYDPSRLPVQVFSWMPYRARVRSPEAAWLETPRSYQVGYSARVNGQPAEIRRSPEGLVSVRVPAGASEVKLKYYPPTGLAALFWLSLASIGVGAAFLGGISLTRPAARAQG
jgi:hypothetical protein